MQLQLNTVKERVRCARNQHSGPGVWDLRQHNLSTCSNVVTNVIAISIGLLDWMHSAFELAMTLE